MERTVKKKTSKTFNFDAFVYIRSECMWVRLKERRGNREGAGATGHVYVWINSETQRRVEIEPFGLIRMITAQLFRAHTQTNDFRSHNVF